MKKSIFLHIAIVSLLFASTCLNGCSNNQASSSNNLSNATMSAETTKAETTTENIQDDNVTDSISNNEDDFKVMSIGGPTKYDSDGNPLYDEYGSEFEKIWKSNDGKMEFVLDNSLGIEGRGGYDCKYTYKGKVFNVELDIDYGCMSINVENLVSEILRIHSLYLAQ